MDDFCNDWTHEHVNHEINTVQQCQGCGGWDMVIRDPRRLPPLSYFAYCPWCGLTYKVV